MELFNKYKNKNFTFLTNYINGYISGNSSALTEEALCEQLSGTAQSSFEEFLLALVNSPNAADGRTAALLYRENGEMYPIRQAAVPIRATIAEKAWLYYILQDSKADLFLEPQTKEKLIAALEADPDRTRYPIKPEYIDIRRLSPDNRLWITEEYAAHFKTIVQAIQDHRYLFVGNTAFSGNVYANQKVIPYKLEYAAQFDSFSLSCYPLEAKRPVKMNLRNLSSVQLGEDVEDYKKFTSDFESMLADVKEKTPITIEIQSQAEAYDRCAYLFSSYNTVCYDKGNNSLIMRIYYYRFQKEEIIRNILYLGHYVKIIAPEPLVEEVISEIRRAYKAYQ